MPWLFPNCLQPRRDSAAPFLGYPSRPEENDYFVTMLEKTRKRMTAQQVSAVAHLLEEQAAKRQKK